MSDNIYRLLEKEFDGLEAEVSNLKYENTALREELQDLKNEFNELLNKKDKRNDEISFSQDKWKHACLCACNKIKRLKFIMDLQNYMAEDDAKEKIELLSQIEDWKFLYSRLGGDDWSSNSATPDSVLKLARELEERERACVAYSIAEELGIMTDEMRFGEDFEETVRQVKEGAKKMRIKLNNITIGYDGEQKRVEQAEERYAKEASLRYNSDLQINKMAKQLEDVETKLAEYIEIVKNFVKNMGMGQPVVPNLIPAQPPSLEFTYTCSNNSEQEMCPRCGGWPGVNNRSCVECRDTSSLRE